MSFTYGEDNRLHAVSDGVGTLGTYTYNGRGERVKKAAGATVTYYQYDVSGQLLAESDDDGNTLREYVYFNGMAVALIDVTGSGAGTVMDNDGCGFSVDGDWTRESTVAGYQGSDYRITTPGTGTKRAIWQPDIAASGEYTVYARWTSGPDRASDAEYAIVHSGGTAEVTVDQRTGGGLFQRLGTWTLAPGATITLTDNANGAVVADAIKLVASGDESADIYYIHPDHLGTPQVITGNPADPQQTPPQVVWQASYDPFGQADITTETITSNLRFPGQYFDAETGLHYNYYRDYDPGTGRYIESDPIGLVGGQDTYGYVNQNPGRYTDQLGLLAPSIPSKVATGVAPRLGLASLGPLGLGIAIGVEIGELIFPDPQASFEGDSNIVPFPASSPRNSQADNESECTSDNGSGCEYIRRILEAEYSRLAALRPKQFGSDWGQIVLERKQFNDTADKFDLVCRPPFGKRFPIGPKLGIPGTPLLNDIYGR